MNRITLKINISQDFLDSLDISKKELEKEYQREFHYGEIIEMCMTTLDELLDTKDRMEYVNTKGEYYS